MADFKKAKFGDLFKFKTGEICEYIGQTEDSVHLRPVGYKGLMVYSEVIDCPNAYTNWEVYTEEDDWNLEYNLKQMTKNTSMVSWYYVADRTLLMKLKEKIIEDINKLYVNEPNSSVPDKGIVLKEDVYNVLNKRFGF